MPDSSPINGVYRVFQEKNRSCFYLLSCLKLEPSSESDGSWRLLMIRARGLCS